MSDLEKEVALLKAQLAAKQGQGLAPSPDMTDLKPGQMPTCTCLVKLDESHSVVLTGVTPAEMLVLVAEHNKAAKCNPISDIVYTGPAIDKVNKQDVVRSAVTERNRLKTKYNPVKINAVYPGAIPQLPSDFAQAQQLGMGVELPTAKLVEVGGKAPTA